jgi:drug/metabolite transporter (DMT)-like permease
MRSIFVWMAISFFFYAVGDYLSKKWSMHPSWTMALMAVLCYTITSAAWLPALNRLQSLTITGMIWNISYVIITTLLGLLVFDERLSFTQSVGLVAGTVSIIMMLL